MQRLIHITCRQSSFLRRVSYAVLGCFLIYLVVHQMSSEANLADNVVVGYVTAPPDKAEPLATALVESGLVACVNILPSIKSIYIWENKLESATESLLVVKTTQERSDEVTAAIKRLHPYDVPEVIFSQITGGNDAYINWVRNATKARPL
jgi:periplasmic divalent cation tolerance protein